MLAPDEPAPVSAYNYQGKSSFLLVADHAGNLIPRALGRLGLTETDCKRHIAWDIGIAGLARLLADQLKTNLIEQIIRDLLLIATVHWMRPLRLQISAKIRRSPVMPTRETKTERRARVRFSN